MKIGILGGSFNPIHKGHMHIAEAAFEKADMDEIWLMPTGISPHKDIAGAVNRFQRLDMVKLVAEEKPYFKAFDYEIYKDKRCFTYETLTELKELYPKDEFYFIVGEDSVDLFATWKKPEIIAKCASLLVATRDEEGKENDDIIEKAAALAKQFDFEVKVISTENVPVSSTEIREAVASGKDIKGLVSDPVLRYIREHHLYESESGHGIDDDAIDVIRKKLKKTLKEKRYKHSLGVMNTAVAMAMRYGIDPGKAKLAGLLHDCTKFMKDKEQIEFCKKHDIKITESELNAPWLLHAKTGEYMARHDYGVEDPEVLSAIRWHTTGHADMTLLEKIVFTADYIEPGRCEAPRLPEIRQAAFVDLDLAIIMILNNVISYLEEGGRPIDPKSKETYMFYSK